MIVLVLLRSILDIWRHVNIVRCISIEAICELKPSCVRLSLRYK